MRCLKHSFISGQLGFFESKGSKFLAYVYNVNLEGDLDEFKIFKNAVIEDLRAEHKKAVHFVEAFRILDSNDMLFEGCSDDGEPKNSSAPPMLEVLRGENLVNILCVCVRYFGGIKLGVGGLVRAYSNAVLDSVSSMQREDLLLDYEKMHSQIFNIKSASFNRLCYLADKYNLSIVSKEFLQDNVMVALRGSRGGLEKFALEMF